MEKTYYNLCSLSCKFMALNNDLKDKTIFAVDGDNNITECRLLRIETTITKGDNEKAKANNLLVINMASKGIIKVKLNEYRFFKTERAIYDNTPIQHVYVEVTNYKFREDYLRLLFSKVTNVIQINGTYGNIYVFGENYTWDKEGHHPNTCCCYVDITKVGFSKGYGDDVHLFSIDGKPTKDCILYSYLDETWVGTEDAITDEKVYLTEDDCISDNRPTITRFADGEEENDSDKFVEVVLI